MEHINLSQELIDQYKEAFSLFDEDGDGLITGEELGIVIRALGHTVTEAEIDELILGKNCTGCLSLLSVAKKSRHPSSAIAFAINLFFKF